MTKPKFSKLALVAPLLGVISCAAPKAILVQETKPAGPEVAQTGEPAVTMEPDLPLPDDKLRIGDMETLPSDEELRASRPEPPLPGTGAGAVIARPPTEPPPRPKTND
jgi:hypothetical protein